MRLFGINLEKTTYGDFLDKVTTHEWRYKIYTPNPEILLTAKQDSNFHALLSKGDVIIPDGIGLYLGYQIFDNKMGAFVNKLLLPWFVWSILFRKKWLYARYGDRICGSDATRELIEYAAQNNIEAIIIEPLIEDIVTKQDAAKVLHQQKTAQILEKKYPGLTARVIVVNGNSYKMADIKAQIDTEKPAFLFCTFGAVKQEKFIEDTFEKLPNVKLAIGCGGSIDFLTGFYERSPQFWRSLGFEWLWRITQNPSRQIKKIKRALFDFLWAVYEEKAKNPTIWVD